MAAIWSPPMKSCPVTSAIDIAKTISTDAYEVEEDIDNVSSIGSFGSFGSSYSNRRTGLLYDEDEAIRTILGTKSEEKEVKRIQFWVCSDEEREYPFTDSKNFNSCKSYERLKSRGGYGDVSW